MTRKPRKPSFACAHSYGFTLAETLIVLMILGVVAALTVPTLVKRQSEAANRTKIKKAMRTYDAAIQQMAVVNNLRSDSALTSWADSADKNNCANTSAYFKVVSGAGCQFRTSDGLWWDISNIKKPIVAFEQANLTEEAVNGNDNKAFYFVTSFDPKAKAFRTNDAQYEIANDGASEEMKKLFAFVKPELGGGNGGGDNENQECDDSDSFCKAARGDYDTPCPQPRIYGPSCTLKSGSTFVGGKERDRYDITDESANWITRYYIDDDGSRIYSDINPNRGYGWYWDCSSTTPADKSTCKGCWYVKSKSECDECKQENGCTASPA